MNRPSALSTATHSVADKTLRAMAKVVTDRRWAATATAMALGFGLFIGVAIGPGASGSLAGAAPQIVEVPASSGGTDEGDGGSGGDAVAVPAPSAAGAATSEAAPEPEYATSTPYEPPPLEPLPVEAEPQTPPTEPAPEAPAPEEEPEPEGQVLEGTVVHANPAAGSYALAIKGDELVAVHSAKLPPAGTKLSLPVQQLANGTFAEQETPENEGKASKARFTGTVTFADPDPAAPAYTVSGRGASVLVRVEPDPSGAAPALPPLGSFATVDVRIGTPPAAPDSAAVPAPTAPFCELGPGVQPARASKPPLSALWQQKLEVENLEPSTYLEVAGVVSGLCIDRSALLLSADDAGDGEGDLLLAVSPKVNAAKLRVAASIVTTIEVAGDGTLTLTGVASDERAKGADDAKTAQGDLKR